MKHKNQKTAKTKTELPAQPATPIDDIVQPDPNAKDSQGHIRENARKGEPMPVPNTVGYKPIDAPIVDAAEDDDE